MRKVNCSKIYKKKNINNARIKWIDNFSNIKNGPVIFFGNEFFDSIPIKQFLHKDGFLFEKYYSLKKNYTIKEILSNWNMFISFFNIVWLFQNNS